MPDPADDNVRYAVLGPVRAWRADAPLMLGPPQQQAVLAALLLSAGRPVHRDELLHALWGEDLPPTALHTLRSYVSRLRAGLRGDHGHNPLVSVGGGYALPAPTAAVDVRVLEELLGAAARARATGRLDRAVMLLDQGLALPQGTPLAGLAGPFADRQRDRLGELLLGAEQQRAEVALELGRHAELIAGLRDLTDRHPLRERLHELLMLGLYRSGRQAEAIMVFLDARRHLDKELGVAPGPALQTLYERVIRADPALSAPPPDVAAAGNRPVAAAGSADRLPRTGRGSAAAPQAPHLLPRALAGFVEREEEQRWLDRVCDADPGVRLVVVAGGAGCGKTSLVVRWAHTAADRFPDGQLYGDFRGFSANGPVRPTEVLRAFLQAMSVGDDEIPDGLDARASLYRRLVGERRMLVVLDSVLSAEDVAPFLPAGGASLTVVCSRRKLEGLVVQEEAAVRGIGAFSTATAHEMLRCRLGERRALEDPRASRRLVELCERLPLALSLALAQLTAHPDWTVADLVGDLEDERTRLATLGGGAGISMELELALSRQQLPTEAARLLPLLALHPGTEIDASAAAALLGRPIAAGRRALAALAALHLLAEAGPGRYQAHDLVRLYCRELLEQEVPAAAREAGTVRLLEYYLAATAAAAESIRPRRRLHRPGRPPAGGVPVFPSPARAMAWFRREEPAIRDLAAPAPGRRPNRHGYRLAENAALLYVDTGLFRDGEKVADPALAAARGSGENWPHHCSTHALAPAFRGHLEEALHQAGYPPEAPADKPLLHLRLPTTSSRPCWVEVLMTGGRPPDSGDRPVDGAVASALPGRVEVHPHPAAADERHRHRPDD